MRSIIRGIALLCLLLFSTKLLYAAEEEFSGEKIMAELEKALKLSNEKMAQMKPEIDARSEELKKSINGSIDKGFVRMDEWSAQLDEASKRTEKKVREFLTGEEYLKFKTVMSNIDKEAIEETRQQIVTDMTEILELSEQQITELKPMLEEIVAELTSMLESFSQQGISSWKEISREYEGLMSDFRGRIEELLSAEQLNKLDKYSEEKKNKLRQDVEEV